MRKLFTSESVTEGHPDKLCDLISDSILDELISKDPQTRAGIETVAGKGYIFITGEVKSNAKDVNIEEIARETIKNIGYDNSEIDIDYKTCTILVNISSQSPDIALGVDKSLEEKEGEGIISEGAGDQGMMFGFACNETENYMPMPINFAHRLTKKLSEVRKQGIISYLRPDGKAQVTIEYVDGKPARVDTIVLSAQHGANIPLEKVRKD